MVATCGTVTGAAEALHYTPSAVSQQLRTLGEGPRRGPRRAGRARASGSPRPPASCSSTPTSCSARWEEIRGLVAAAADARAAARCGSADSPPRRRRCCRASPRSVRATHPRCQVRIIEADPEECFDLLLADEADVAVVVATADAPVDRRSPVRAELPARGPAGPARAGEPPAGPGALGAARRPGRTRRGSWTDPAGRTTSCCRRPAPRPASPPQSAHVATEWDTGAALVAAGLGIALIPRLAHLPAGYPIVRVPLRGDPTPSRHILTGIRRGSAQQPLIAARARDARGDGREPQLLTVHRSSTRQPRSRRPEQLSDLRLAARGQGRGRTADLPLFRRTLVPTELPAQAPAAATPTGLEPAASAVTGRRANQLRYGAMHHEDVRYAGAQKG